MVYASKERVAAMAKSRPMRTWPIRQVEGPHLRPLWLERLQRGAGQPPYSLHHDAAETKAWVEGVKANLARKPQGGDRDQAKAIWAGECDIALGNTYYMGQMLADPEQTEWANSVRIVFPQFENSGTHMNVSGIAMTKAAPNHDAALKLMEWLSTDAAQKIYAETNHEFPVKAGVERSELVKSWGTFTADSLPLADVAAQRPAALKLIEEVDFDG